MTTNDPMPALSKPKRRWFQFSLRGLLVIVTVLAVWLGLRVKWARQQADAVAAIRQAGGLVLYDCQFVQQESGMLEGPGPWEPKWLIDLVGIDFFHQARYVSFAYGKANETELDTSDELYVHLEQLPHVRRLLLVEGQVTDQRMDHVAKLKHLECLLLLESRALTDAGVQRLSELRNLEYVFISNSQITDESIAFLATHCPQLKGLLLPRNRFTNQVLDYASKLPDLKQLVVSGGDGSINDHGLAHVKKLRKLQELGLQGSRVTDAGLEHLSDMGTLRVLSINGTAVTPAGVAELQQALPNLKISSIADGAGVLIRPL